ncbi:MAG: site-specific integrase [Verrucomicrobia bacterium]|nr:site-specific integrase [Verrucomicrobiota bacterium]
MKLRRTDDQLQVHDIRQAPYLRDFVPQYLEDVKTRKRPETYRKEVHVLNRWVSALGGRRLNAIRKADILDFRASRLKEGTNPRTANIDVIVLRQLLKYAFDQDRIGSLPTVGLSPLKAVARKREFVPPADIDRLISCALTASKNGRQVADYLMLLRYSGGREKEVLRLRWKDVDFDRNQLVIGADGLSKNHEARIVDLNGSLRDHLADMNGRRAPDSQWLFPSPQRGEKDEHAKTFRESLRLARKAAGMPSFGFHDLRHAFCSAAVMAGIDFMTVARWLGHKDGGMLIGKVYGHIADDHRKRQAAKLDFTTKEPPTA